MPNTAKPVKDAAKAILDKLPDDASWEDVQYHLYVRQQIEAGLEDDAAGRLVDTDQYYKSADLGVFASSCENLPITLLENMASGLPIACSNLGPMPEVLGKAGVYFDPESGESIRDAIEQLVLSPRLRADVAQLAFARSKDFNWERCAKETFSFLERVSLGHRQRA